MKDKEYIQQIVELLQVISFNRFQASERSGGLNYASAYDIATDIAAQIPARIKKTVLTIKSPEDVIKIEDAVNKLHKMLERYKQKHPEEKQAFERSIGGVMNAYREGNIDFIKAKQILEDLTCGKTN